MTPLVQSVTSMLSFFVVLGYGVVLLIFVSLVAKSASWAKSVLNFFGSRAVLFSFLVALGGMVTSLFYSDYAGFSACYLCWWQRLFLYPQVLLLGLALKIKDKKFPAYSFALSVVGGAVAVYHTFIQFGGVPLIPCPATGPSCTQRYFLEFGFVTIPTMALAAFLLIISFMLASRASKNFS